MVDSSECIVRDIDIKFGFVELVDVGDIFGSIAGIIIEQIVRIGWTVDAGNSIIDGCVGRAVGGWIWISYYRCIECG